MAAFLTAAQAEALHHAQSALTLRANRLRHEACSLSPDTRELLEHAAEVCEASATTIAAMLGVRNAHKS